MDKIEIKCEKTVTGKHILVKMGGNDPALADLPICIACGLIDDRKVDRKEKK